MKEPINVVVSLEDYLEKVIRPILSNPRSLRSGRPLSNIGLRPREVLGLFLMSVLGKSITGQNWTASSDPDSGDGVVICLDPKREGEGFALEQVYVLSDKPGTQLSDEEFLERIKIEVNKKIKKGAEYCSHRHLVIFTDVWGSLDHVRLKRYVDSLPNRFYSYCLIGRSTKDSLSYLIFLLRGTSDRPAVYEIRIDAGFRSWAINRLGRL